LRQALRLSDDKRPLYSDLGRTLTLKGEFDAAKKVLIRSLRLAENAPELTAHERERAISQAHVDLAELAIHCGDKLSAQQSLERAQRCPSEHSDLHAKIHNLLGVTARMVGKLDEAAAHYRRAEALYDALGDLERSLSVKLNLSNVMADAGDRATAFAADEAVRAKARRMGDKKHEAMAAANQGEELLARGDFALAQQMLEQAAQLLDKLNYIQYANHVCLNLTLVWLRQGDMAAAKSQLSALAARMEQTSPQHRARFELASGEYWLLQGQADVAVDLLEQATETLDVLQEVREAIEGYTLLVLACAFDSPSDVPDYLIRAAELANSLSDPLYKQQVAYLQGCFENDAQMREAAKGWLEQAGYGHFVVRIENILANL
jgi:tetratricopeptide (TPR) repeat protein